MLWGGLVRIFFVHHITWSINSICHFHGARRFATDDHSTNVWWLSLASLGEAWHHNHHAFPRSAFHGLRWWELDPSGLVIRAMKRARAGMERGRDRARAPDPAAGGDAGRVAGAKRDLIDWRVEHGTTCVIRQSARPSGARTPLR